MALLSANRVSLFNESLLGLIRTLIEQGWNERAQTQDYGAFLIDLMQFYLDPVQRPFEDLVAAFSKVNNNDNLIEYQESSSQLNFMRQRRVMVTPTLIKFSVAQEE